ncbi:hypothetical protein SNE40_003213 [Patella caerulea]|uniref:Uncharacterized protein n=1 Tax=Patella caerulea TaxID=87958 RepID=A0AAN8Q4U9_PATCE
MERKRKSATNEIDFSSEDDESKTDCNSDDSRKYQKQNHSEIEKRRRDKMNNFIVELSALIPMCNAMNRKLDKLTVLRMAVQHMKSIKGANKSYTEISLKPSFISEEELKHVILKVSDGFLFVVSCDRAKILYCSQSVSKTLDFSHKELIGQSWFDILHPQDISKIKEQLSSSDLSPRERLIDAKTMMPVKTELPQKSSQLCSGARRSFFCRMRTGGKASASNNLPVPKNKIDADSMMSPRKKKTDRKNFSVIHCTGYLKSWPVSKVNLDEDKEIYPDLNSLSCLVVIGRPQKIYQSKTNFKKHINVRPLEYTSRHSVDGKFQYVDERATIILGLLPQELLGTSVYEYYHQKDIAHLADVHRKVLQTKEKVQTNPYRFKSSGGRYVVLQSTCFGFQNPFTKEVEYIVSMNKIVSEPEVTGCDTSEEILIKMNQNFSNDKIISLGSTSACNSRDLPGISIREYTSAGRIGTKIAEESMDSQVTADSSSLEVTPLPQRFAVPMNVRVPLLNSASSSTSLSQAACSSKTGNVQWSSRLGDQNGHITVNSKSPQAAAVLDSTLLNDVLEEQMVEDMQNPGNDGNDEAALAFLMSLLEADAGLGGPIDFNDLPWPL